MDNIKTLELNVLPSPGNSNLSFMQILTPGKTLTVLLSKADAAALQTCGMLNELFTIQPANVLHD